MFEFLIEHSPQDVKLSQACQLSDGNLFRAMLASRRNRAANLSKQEQREIADAAQNNNTKAVYLMLATGWPVDVRGECDMTPVERASWHGNAEMVREILRYKPQLEVKCEPGIAALGSAFARVRERQASRNRRLCRDRGSAAQGWSEAAANHAGSGSERPGS